MTTRFKAGDRIFTASSVWTPQPKKCPVCEGTTRILVKALGAPDDRGEEMSCEYCRWALRDGLKAGHVVEEWDWAPHVTEILVEGVEVIDRPGRKEVKYLYNCSSCSWNSVRDEDVYPDIETALAAAKAKTAAAPQPSDHPNPSHTVGYARKQIKDAKEQAERWEKHIRNRP